VAFTAPVPRPTHRVSHDGPTAEWHSRATLGLRPVLSRSLGNEAGARRSFHPLHPPMVSPTDVRFELGPRSLDPAAVFAARLPSLFETRRRLTTSATALRGTGNQTRALVFSLGRWPRPPSVFLHTTPSPLRERWCAASRASFASKTPVLVPSACADLPNRDALESAPPPTGFTRSVHSEDQRARVEGPSEGRVPWRMRRCLVRASGAYA
jgi:hypothetical protein